MFNAVEPLHLGDAVIVTGRADDLRGQYQGRVGVVIDEESKYVGVTLFRTEKHPLINNVSFLRDDLQYIGRNTADPKVLDGRKKYGDE